MSYIEIRFAKGDPMRFDAFEMALFEGKRLGRSGDIYKVEDGAPDVLLARVGVHWQPKNPKPIPRGQPLLGRDQGDRDYLARRTRLRLLWRFS